MRLKSFNFLLILTICRNPESEEDLMAIVLDKQYVEHDSFTLFLSLMASAKQWYEFKEDQKFPRLPV